MKENSKIDFVVTWVDGGDLQWQKEKQRWLSGNDADVDVSAIRYRDWDNLRYWFRAVEKYAPWVNKVHFVTNGQLPDWLNLDAPKLNFVKHSDYIPMEWLPTFSSHPIEFNVHRIEGLSEQFVLFNDDFFLTAPVKPEDFFVDGLPCDSIREDPLAFEQTELYNFICLNDLMFVNDRFERKEVRSRLGSKWFSLRAPADLVRNMITSLMRHNAFFGIDTHHLPQAYLKRTFQEVWEREPELLAEVCSHKFRDARDISHHSLKFWQLMNGNFQPYDKHRFGKVLNVSWTDRVCNAIENRQYKAICINDAEDVDFEAVKAKINGAFEKALPEKSSFEL